MYIFLLGKLLFILTCLMGKELGKSSVNLHVLIKKIILELALGQAKFESSFSEGKLEFNFLCCVA